MGVNMKPLQKMTKAQVVAFCLMSLCAGIMIGIGGTAFLLARDLYGDWGRLIGAIFFSLGILVIVMFEMKLFTGLISYMPEMGIKNWWQLPVCFVGNMLGVFFAAVLVYYSPLADQVAPGAQTMMQAKLDYFNTFRHIERDDFSLATVLMFGLYGNPMLHVKARQDVIDAAQRYEVLPRLPQSKAVSAPVRTKRIKQLISKEQLQGSKSLLEQLRGCVDENLTIIHGIVQQNLYQQLGLDPRWLCGVSSFEMPDEAGELLQGYLYSYDDDNKYGRKSIIEVSSNGDITRKITFK